MSSWIKLEKITADKPEVHELAALLGLDPDMVLGKLIRFWNWADGVMDDGRALNVKSVTVDRLTHFPGFAVALEKVGWLRLGDDCIEVPNFSNHMGESAKKRAKDQKAKAAARRGADKKPTKPGQKPDQSRVEKSDTPKVPKGDGDPPPENPLYTASFKEFWAAYPRKQKKLAAGRAWGRHGCAQRLHQILAAIEAQKRGPQWKKDGGEFIPNPATWLNGGGWDDEVIAPEKKAASRPSTYQGT